MKNSIWNKSYIYSGTGILVLVLGWIIVSTVADNSLIFPTVNQIFEAIVNIFGKTDNLKYILFDILRIVFSILVSFLVSIIVVFIYIRFKNSYHFLKPILVFFKTIPVVAISIFIWLLVGGKSVPIITTVLVTIPVIIQGLIGAINSMDRNLVDELKMVNNNHFVAFFHVYLPYLLPYIFITFFQTFGLGLKVMVTSEYLSQTNNSIGKALYNAQSNIALDVILAWSIIIIVFVGLCEMVMKKISKGLEY
ncbi:MAG: ABC transporter permease subunit [Bacilli bacterium]|nr:ABC transporter permease subunit [Bacilli bacterium]